MKRTAVTVIPKQPFIDWANSVDDGHVKFGNNPSPKHTIYLVEHITDFVVDTIEIVSPNLEFIFKEELNSWHHVENHWPPNRDLEIFLEWFEIQIHSMEREQWASLVHVYTTIEMFLPRYVHPNYPSDIASFSCILSKRQLTYRLSVSDPS